MLFKLLKLSKKNSSTNGTLIIMLTALNDRGSKVKMREVGANDFISYPLFILKR
ncbi:hypothetical protein [Deferribacter autotrophicus]|uniref:hypothetical protein n=1 Tax=Deferribacter autotrophicus TaxID=500465 RepID=UPI00165DC1B7|nr:hypothetical protein [Deferribacter autotrophicus]